MIHSRTLLLAVPLSFVFSCSPPLPPNAGDDAGAPGDDAGAQAQADAGVCGAASDSDGDGISNSDEGGGLVPPRDTDGDGTADFLDLDSDADGVADAIERGPGAACSAPVDSDADGKPDFADIDSDDSADGTVRDAEEVGADVLHPLDSDHDGAPDFRDADNDGDGIADRVELTAQASLTPATVKANAPDTDTDGLPDFLDPDADGDAIADAHDGAVDTDSDGLPNYRDLDSDNDCVLDAAEAGDGDFLTAPLDTDTDGNPDFADADSDNDGLVDGAEDQNCNGMLEACESNRLAADTDADAVADLIEVAHCAAQQPGQQAVCACNVSTAASSPLTQGDLVFVSEHNAAPVPALETVSLSTTIDKVDVILAVDSTASMSGVVSQLKIGLQSLASGLRAAIKDVSMGLVDFKDFGESYVAKYDYRNTTFDTSAGLSGLQAAFNALTAAGGGDSAEAGWEALYSIAGSATISVSGWNSHFDLATTAPTSTPTGETQGLNGGAGFRDGLVPLVVTVSDAEWHDAPGVAVNGENGLNQYTSAQNGVPSRATVITALKSMGVHVIGLAGSGTAVVGDPKARMLATASETGASVDPADFGSVGVRPAGCSIAQCCTGSGGAGEAPSNGTCPLAFSYAASTGSGVTAAVSSGVVTLVNHLKLDVYPVASDVDQPAVAPFIDKLVPNLTGVGPAASCLTSPPLALEDRVNGPTAAVGTDGVLDTFPQLKVGSTICFNLVAKMNTTVASTSAPQVFHAVVRARADTAALGEMRHVFFIVPPKIVNGPKP